MPENSTANNIDQDEFTFNSEESDYQILIIRLNDISKAIAILEKIISK